MCIIKCIYVYVCTAYVILLWYVLVYKFVIAHKLPRRRIRSQ